MNLYIRYFDEECVVSSAEEAFDFLSSLPGITLDEAFVKDLRQYMDSPMPYPKRYKVRPRVYFIVIKTAAANMQDFKDKKAVRPASVAREMNDNVFNRLVEERPGWYEGSLDFKRVVLIPATGKFEYRDTHFVANVKAMSGQDCYDRIIEHLRERVDSRSQFPSVKGKNYHFRYLGMWK